MNKTPLIDFKFLHIEIEINACQILTKSNICVIIYIMYHLWKLKYFER